MSSQILLSYSPPFYSIASFFSFVCLLRSSSPIPRPSTALPPSSHSSSQILLSYSTPFYSIASFFSFVFSDPPFLFPALLQHCLLLLIRLLRSSSPIPRPSTALPPSSHSSSQILRSYSPPFYSIASFFSFVFSDPPFLFPALLQHCLLLLIRMSSQILRSYSPPFYSIASSFSFVFSDPPLLFHALLQHCLLLLIRLLRSSSPIPRPSTALPPPSHSSSQILLSYSTPFYSIASFFSFVFSDPPFLFPALLQHCLLLIRLLRSSIPIPRPSTALPPPSHSSSQILLSYSPPFYSIASFFSFVFSDPPFLFPALLQHCLLLLIRLLRSSVPIPRPSTALPPSSHSSSQILLSYSTPFYSIASFFSFVFSDPPLLFPALLQHCNSHQSLLSYRLLSCLVRYSHTVFGVITHWQNRSPIPARRHTRGLFE